MRITVTFFPTPFRDFYIWLSWKNRVYNFCRCDNFFFFEFQVHSFLKDKIQSLDNICPFVNSIWQKLKLYKHAVSTLICLALLYLSWYTLQNYYSMTLTKCPNWRWGIKRSQQQKKWPQVKYKIWPSVKKIHLQIIGQGLWSIIESHLG